MGSIHTILFQETDDVPANAVVASLTDHTCFHTASSQRYDSVERTAARDGIDGLFVFEDNVEYGLAYTNYFSHTFLIFVQRY